MPNINSVGDKDNIIQNLQRALDGAAQRQKIITNNVANVDTPNFKRSEVHFQQALQNSINSNQRLTMKTTDPRHIASGPSSRSGQSPVIQDTGSTFRRDGNNVDIEREIVEMSKNSLYYNATTQMLNDKYKTLKAVIADGGNT